MNCLQHPDFKNGELTTAFIDEHPELKITSASKWNFANALQSDPKKLGSSERRLRYLANLSVNGHPTELGVDASKLATGVTSSVPRPVIPASTTKKNNLRSILLNSGPEAMAKAVREHKGLLIMDTTWRDAHQSLLATRMRTQELERCAEATNEVMANAFSMEMWGGK